MESTENKNKLWSGFIERTKDNPPRPDLVKALTFVQERGAALDLGSGALTDSKYLLAEGFEHITAVDQSNLAQEIYNTLPHGKVDYIISSFEDYGFPAEQFDLVSAQYSLPFSPSQSFNTVFRNIVRSLKTGGIFVGQLFGERDQWNTPETRMTFRTREQVEALLSTLEIVELKEEEQDKNLSPRGPIKHWHEFHIIARKASVPLVP